MNSMGSEDPSYDAALPHFGFEQLMETDHPGNGVLNQLMGSVVDDENDNTLDEFGFDDPPFAIPEQSQQSSVLSSSNSQRSQCSLPALPSQVSEDLDFDLAPFNGNFGRKATASIGIGSFNTQEGGSRALCLTGSQVSKSSDFANGNQQISNGRVHSSNNLVLNSRSPTGPDTGGGQSIVVQLSNSDLYTICQKLKRDLSKKELGILKMKKLIIEEQQLIVNIRRKRDEAVLDITRCKEEYNKLDASHQELLQDYEKVKRDVTSGKLIIQQLTAKISHLTAENKALQAQIKGTCDPEKDKLKDEVKELHKLVKRNEKTIDSKTDAIQNLRNALATAQTLSEVLKQNFNKNSLNAKGSDLVSVPNFSAEAPDQKQVISAEYLKNIMDEFRSEIYSLIKSAHGTFPAVKTKTKSMFDVSDTEDSESPNIRSCTSSIPSYDDDIFDDNFVPSISSESPPCTEDLVVSTVETEALSLGEYAKTIVNFSNEKQDNKNTNIPVTLSVHDDYQIFENKKKKESKKLDVPSLEVENLAVATSEHLELSQNPLPCENGRTDPIKLPCKVPEIKCDSSELKTVTGSEIQTNSEHSISNTDLSQLNKSLSCDELDNNCHVNQATTVSPIKKEPTSKPINLNKTKPFRPVNTNRTHCLSDSDSDDSVSSSSEVKHRPNPVFAPVVPEISSVSSPSSCKMSEDVPGKNIDNSQTKGIVNSSSDDEYYSDSDSSDTGSDEDAEDVSTSISSEDEREADNVSNNKSKFLSDAVVVSHNVNLKESVSPGSPHRAFSLQDDLDLSSEESDMSEPEVENEVQGSVLFPASPSKNGKPSGVNLVESYPSKAKIPSPLKSVISDLHDQKNPTKKLSDAISVTSDSLSKHTEVEIAKDSVDLTRTKEANVVDSEIKPSRTITVSVASPINVAKAITPVDAISAGGAANHKAGDGEKKFVPDRKVSGFLRRIVSKSNSKTNNVEIPGRTPTLPQIFRRQAPVEVFGVKRPFSATVTKDVSMGDGEPEAHIHDDRTTYELPAKKIRVSHVMESHKNVEAAPSADVECDKNKLGSCKSSAVSKENHGKLSNSNSSQNKGGTQKSISKIKTAVKEKEVSLQVVTRMRQIQMHKEKFKNSVTEAERVGIVEKICDKEKTELNSRRVSHSLRSQGKDTALRASTNLNSGIKCKQVSSDTLPLVPEDKLAKVSKIHPLVNNVQTTADSTRTVSRLKDLPRPAEVRMSAKDKIKNSMTEIIQIGSGENMCDKKKLELKAQHTIERLKAEKNSRKDLIPTELPSSQEIQQVVVESSLRTKVCEKSSVEAFMKSAPAPFVRRTPFLKKESSAVVETSISSRVTRHSVRNKEKPDDLLPKLPTRTSPRKRNQDKISSLVESSLEKNKPAGTETMGSSTSLPSSSTLEDTIFNEMFQELAKKNTSTKSNTQSKESVSAPEDKDGAKKPKPCPPPKTMTLVKLIVGRYARSLTTDEMVNLIQKNLSELTEHPPSEVFVAQKIYSELTESINSYLLERIDEHSLIIGCRKLCSAITSTKSLLPNLYPNLDVVAVTYFTTKILGDLRNRFDRNDVLNMLGLCYGVICREFSFRDLAFQMLHMVLVKRVRQKSCFSHGFVSGYPDMWSFPFESGSILERTVVVALTCSPLYCDSIYYKGVRQIFIEGIGLVLPELTYKQFFAYILNDFKELEFQKSIEDGEKGLLMLLLQCDWQQSIQIIEEYSISIYNEWKEKKIPDTIFNSFLRVAGWACELTTDPEPKFSAIQGIFGRLKHAHRDDLAMAELLRQSITDGFNNLGKLVERGPYNGTELIYYRISDIVDHSKKRDKKDKTERRRIKRKIKRKNDGRAKRKEKLKEAQ